MLDDLPKLIDDTAKTIMSCKNIRLIGNLLERGKNIKNCDGAILLQDLAILRYRYTLDRVQHQAIEILSRTWETPEEAIKDLQQAGKLISWLIKEYEDQTSSP